jgi:GNAT superfamily N-acetyltransferase
MTGSQVAATAQRLHWTDETTVRAWLDLVLAAAADYPGTARPCPIDLRGSLRYWPPGAELENWVVPAGSGVVGALQLSYRAGDDTASVDQLLVHPDHRGAGIGRTLLRLAADRAAEHGRGSLLTGLVEQYDAAHPRPSRPVEFAAAAGAERVGRGLTQRLVVDDQVRVETLRHSTPPSGYTLERWGTVIPAAWVGQASVLEMTTGDCPAEALDAAASEGSYLREFEVMRQGRGRRAYQVGVVGPDGRLAGFSSISVTAGNPVEVLQGMTVVSREHRGAGLGRVLKSANLLHALAFEPELRVVDTTNDDNNAAMIAVNRQLGYRPTEFRAFWKLNLPIR